MNIDEFQRGIDKNIGQYGDEVLIKARDVLIPLISIRAKKFNLSYGYIDSIIFIEEIAELIDAIESHNYKLNVLEELVDVELCLISFMHIHNIGDVKAPDVNTITTNRKAYVISHLAKAQQIITKTLRNKATEEQIRNMCIDIRLCINMIKLANSAYGYMYYSAIATKLDRMNDKVLNNDLM